MSNTNPSRSVSPGEGYLWCQDMDNIVCTCAYTSDSSVHVHEYLVHVIRNEGLKISVKYLFILRRIFVGGGRSLVIVICVCFVEAADVGVIVCWPSC